MKIILISALPVIIDIVRFRGPVINVRKGPMNESLISRYGWGLESTTIESVEKETTRSDSIVCELRGRFALNRKLIVPSMREADTTLVPIISISLMGIF